MQPARFSNCRDADSATPKDTSHAGGSCGGHAGTQARAGVPGQCSPAHRQGRFPQAGQGRFPGALTFVQENSSTSMAPLLVIFTPSPSSPRLCTLGRRPARREGGGGGGGGGGAGTRGDISENATHCKGSIRAQDQQCNISSGAAAAACLWLPARGRTPPQTTPMPAGEENRGRRKAQNERARGRVCGEAADRHLNAGMQACLRGRWLGPTPTRRPPAAAAQLDVVVAPQPT